MLKNYCLTSCPFCICAQISHRVYLYFSKIAMIVSQRQALLGQRCLGKFRDSRLKRITHGYATFVPINAAEATGSSYLEPEPASLPVNFTIILPLCMYEHQALGTLVAKSLLENNRCISETAVLLKYETGCSSVTGRGRLRSNKETCSGSGREREFREAVKFMLV